MFQGVAGRQLTGTSDKVEHPAPISNVNSLVINPAGAFLKQIFAKVSCPPLLLAELTKVDECVKVAKLFDAFKV